MEHWLDDLCGVLTGGTTHETGASRIALPAAWEIVGVAFMLHLLACELVRWGSSTVCMIRTVKRTLKERGVCARIV